ncbi:MAG: hypothetical protein GC186_15260 [Rhodobacteraceae bacterium]|nr:hypothetical protein [Paracoccaceae bacterium]
MKISTINVALVFALLGAVGVAQSAMAQTTGTISGGSATPVMLPTGNDDAAGKESSAGDDSVGKSGSGAVSSAGEKESEAGTSGNEGSGSGRSGGERSGSGESGE